MRLPTQTHSVTRLGQAMVDRGLISQDDLERALEHQRTTRKRLGESLIDIGAVTSFQLSQALADHLGVPFVDLETHPPDVLLAGMIPEEVARRYCALPVERWSGQIVVAMANPNDVFALDDIRVLTGQSILAALADTGHLLAAIERAYSRSDLIESTLDDAADDYDVEAEIASGTLVDDGPGREARERACSRRRSPTARPTSTSNPRRAASASACASTASSTTPRKRRSTSCARW